MGEEDRERGVWFPERLGPSMGEGKEQDCGAIEEQPPTGSSGGRRGGRGASLVCLFAGREKSIRPRGIRAKL